MIVAVTGGKGGVGKSTVALGLGRYLDAVLVDADLGTANLPETPGPTLHDVLAGRSHPLEAVSETGEVTMLSCGRSLRGVRGSDPTALVEALAELDAEYDLVVVDCPAGLSADVGLPLYIADRYLLVTTATRTAIPNALRTRALGRTLDAGLQQVVLNKVSGSVPAERLRSVLGAPITTLPEETGLSAPAEILTRSGPVAEQLQSLASQLQEQLKTSRDYRSSW